MSRSNLINLLLFLSLTLTFFSFSLISPWISRYNLLKSNDIESWNCFGEQPIKNEDSQTVTLKLSGPVYSSMVKTIPVSPGTFYYKFEGLIGAKMEKKPHSFWEKPTVFLLFEDSKGKIHWQDLYFIKSFRHSQKIEITKRVFRIPEYTKNILIIFNLELPFSELSFSALKLIPLNANPFYRYYRILFFVINLSLIIGLFFTFLPLEGKKRTFVFASLIFIGMIFPNPLLKKFYGLFNSETVTPIVEYISNPFSLKYYSFNESSFCWIKDFSHFFSFFFLVLMLGFFGVKMNLSFFMGLILFSVFTEIMQGFTISRIPSLRSWLINFSGFLSGFFILKILLKLRLIKFLKKPEKQ